MKALLVAVLIGLLSAAPVRAAAPPPAGDHVLNRPGADYVDILNRNYAAGCAAGAVLGSTAAYLMLPFLSGYFAAFAVNGCAVGLVAGPVGLWVHDALTGDDAVDRYIRDHWY